MALATLSFELPAPFMKGTVFQRNFTFKAVFLLIQATLAILFYQVSDFSACLPTMMVFNKSFAEFFRLYSGDECFYLVAHRRGCLCSCCHGG
jgi:hypothetical protein